MKTETTNECLGLGKVIEECGEVLQNCMGSGTTGVAAERLQVQLCRDRE